MASPPGGVTISGVFSGTEGAFPISIRLVPTEVKLLNLRLAEHMSTLCSIGGERLMTLERHSTGEMDVIKDRCVGA